MIDVMLRESVCVLLARGVYMLWISCHLPTRVSYFPVLSEFF